MSAGSYRLFFCLQWLPADRIPATLARVATPGPRILRTGNPHAQVRAAGALGKVLEIRPDYPKVVTALAVAVGDTSDEVRIAAASALSAEGVDPLAAVAGLHAILHDSAHANVRASIVLIIGRMGSKRARALLPSLREASNDPDARVRAPAVEAIGTIGLASVGDGQAIARLAGDSRAGGTSGGASRAAQSAS